MTFEEVLPKIKAGKKVIRSSWSGSELYIYEVQKPLENGEAVDPYFLIKTRETPSLSMFQPTVCDILASDWEVVE
ncbi:hypothetical protein FC70_GL001474 [Paucilactobacillus oligofermentans DSM 15707 = LMG 22743]|uniref:Thoeris anti-defense 2-like domain-containing protein n=1 Tax=Paucilactobacillus oligofermentans DSM 15707 = LMG 22743 TaxID=1423778 RepID=A0A0R1RHH4_9LACO|nr:DUF2829 domain-containing protein [Paucilactobacillus oligofermentans]KRL54676.1 hypothetical protein FC70_GL001474 [Paucilactobacillus oligofermentans DSM 15707 = LMG 22743]CUS26414.1 Uncharacterized DUF2829 domain-containing protein [Paucilactobacillus oligofermentans DSM 15707 = LMG 22743]